MTRHGGNNAEREALSNNLAALDRYPTCPRCGDICGRLARICGACGCKLRLTLLDGDHSEGVQSPDMDAAGYREDLPPADGTERC